MITRFLRCAWTLGNGAWRRERPQRKPVWASIISSLKKITRRRGKTRISKELSRIIAKFTKTPSLSGDGFDSARVVDERSAVLKQPY